MPKAHVDHEGRILKIVRRHGPILVSSISEITGNDRGTINKAIKRLVKYKILVRVKGIGQALFLKLPGQRF